MQSNDDDSSNKKENPLHNDNSGVSSSEAVGVRGGVGQGMTAFSDLVNNNLIAFRYGTVATVTLLTAYGLANTPLFFRYRSVAEIPAKLFQGRKRLRARLIQTEENDQAGQPLTLYVRHLSPAGNMLSRELFDMAEKYAPSSQVQPTNSNSRDTLKVEIAGVSAPPFYSSIGGYQRGEWLKELAREKTKVTLQLLGRRVAQPKNAQLLQQSTTKRDVSKILPEVQSTLDETNHSDEEQVAICRLYYRPSLFRLFSTDVAYQLVRYGHASVESELFVSSPNNPHSEDSRVLDASNRLDDIRKDVNYLERLSKLEYEAAKGSYGMWSDTLIRDKRRDIVDEVEFQTNATVWQKLWRWIRG